jgi:lysozyme
MTISSDVELIKLHEGCTLVAIRDTKGFSIGYGHDGAQEGDTCTQDEADAWFDADIATARLGAIAALGAAFWALLDPVRRAALVDLAYEMGAAGLRGFHVMLACIRSSQWDAAAEAGLNSDWAKEVPTRAAMDMNILSSGQWPVVG